LSKIVVYGLLLFNRINDGSTRGIRFAIAREFAENNGATIVCSRIKEQSIKAAEQIKGNVFAAEIEWLAGYTKGAPKPPTLH
jgi:NAD(P)-dependent dehydrogenase (short-subunit alcohol dehydrogenase family)